MNTTSRDLFAGSEYAPPQPKSAGRPHTPPADPAMADALAFEQATLDCLDAFKDRANGRAQVEACDRFEKAMNAYMALPKAIYWRTFRKLEARGRITGREHYEIRRRMAELLRQVDGPARDWG